MSKQRRVSSPMRLRPSWGRGGRALFSFAVVFAIWTWLHSAWTIPRAPLPPPEEPSLGTKWDWNSIPAEETLAWVPCFLGLGDRFLCARLKVPMDYNRPLHSLPEAEAQRNPEVHLALVMLPGEGHSLESRNFSASPVILNPGGPGGSGVKLILSAGPGIQAAIGRHHDVISFDPRGVGASWPQADCFLEDHTPEDPPSAEEMNDALMRRLTFLLEYLDVGLANSSDTALAMTVTRGKARSRLCELSDGKDSILRYVGTPNSARDLLSIVQVWEHPWKTPRAAPEPPLKSSLETRGKLVYWGFSYGTVLGSTFAAMFPDRVGRLVLDGVVDLDIYHKEIHSGFLRDTDAVLEDFFQYCHEAHEKCLFGQGDGPGKMRARYGRVMARLETDPLVVIPRQVRMPVIVRATDLKSAVFRMLGFPVAAFPVLALLLLTIERGLDMDPLVTTPDLAPICRASISPPDTYPEESAVAIQCSDRRNHWHESLQDLQGDFEKMARKSDFADLWMVPTTSCSGWKIKPEDPPEFDLENMLRAGKPAIKTSFPILFVSNSHDPITPMQNGLVMSQRFAKAGFIEQLSSGHCSPAELSLCTLGKIRAYLNQGEVPPPPSIDSSTGATKVTSDSRISGKWVQCESDEKPWRPPVRDWEHRDGDTEITEKSWRQIQETFRVSAGPVLHESDVLRDVIRMDRNEVDRVYRELRADLE